MCRLLLPVVALLLLTSIVYSSEIRTWTDDSGKFAYQAKLSGTDDGKIKLATKEGKILKIVPEKLSDADQEFLNKQLEALKQKTAAHTTWTIKMPKVKQGVQKHEVMTMVPTLGIQNGSYETPYLYKSYGYQPVQATLVSYKGTDVTLRGRTGRNRSSSMACSNGGPEVSG